MYNEYTERLIERAERDDDFRARLLSDPRAATGEELGVEIPDSLQIKVVEEGSDDVVVVLPSKARPGGLREEELAAAAGGGATQVSSNWFEASNCWRC